jgi:hypothetical protein
MVSHHLSYLTTPDLVEKVFSSLMDPLDLDPGKSLVSSVDAEWKQSRTFGVSIFQVLPLLAQIKYM